MYIVTQHEIKDRDRFWAVGPQLVGEKAPVGVFPSHDKTEAVCLFEAASIDTLRDFLDPLVGDAGENRYFAVDPGSAVGLPERAATSV